MAHYDHFKPCKHGTAYDEPCVECELVLLRDGVKWAEERLAIYRARIKALEAGPR